MDRRTDAHTDKAKAICPFNFSKVGGITSTDGHNKNGDEQIQNVHLGRYKYIVKYIVICLMALSKTRFPTVYPLK